MKITRKQEDGTYITYDSVEEMILHKMGCTGCIITSIIIIAIVGYLIMKVFEWLDI